MRELKSAATRNLDQYRLLHIADPKYGRSSENMAGQVATLARQLRPASILDFGCGKSQLVDNVAAQLGAKAYRYDPAIKEHSTLPVTKVDLILNTDVLEHLDENEVDVLLSDLASISQNVFFNISTRPAAKILPSGENAHATVRDKNWWHTKILKHFRECHSIQSNPDEARFVTTAIPPGSHLSPTE
jgi:hypothetical protein